MKPVAFLDSSVVLSAAISSTGGSHRILYNSHENKIVACISQNVLDEILEKSFKINRSPDYLNRLVKWSCLIVLPSPSPESISSHINLTPDPDDVHLFAACADLPGCILVSLDKKHILSLKAKVKSPRIMSPSEFLQSLVN